MLNHIVIMGGGFSGSLAAIACSKLANQITLIERSPLIVMIVSIPAPLNRIMFIFLRRAAKVS